MARSTSASEVMTSSALVVMVMTSLLLPGYHGNASPVAKDSLTSGERRAVGDLARAILLITSGGAAGPSDLPLGPSAPLQVPDKRNAELINSLLRHHMPDLQRVGRR